MEISQLKVFTAICSAGSFTAAAEILHMSQPAISQQVALLEKELRTRLFVRGRGGVVLTASGEQLLNDALMIIEHEGLAKRKILQAENKPGKVTISAGGTISAWVLPGLLKKLHSSGFSVHLVERDEAGLRADLKSGAADLVVLDYRPQGANLVIHAFTRDKIMLASSDKKDAKLRPADIKNCRMIFYHDESAIQQIVEARLRELKLWPIKPVMRLRSLVAMKNSIEAGLGIGFVSEKVNTEGLVKVKHRAFNLEREFFLVYRKVAATRLEPLVDRLLKAEKNLTFK